MEDYLKVLYEPPVTKTLELSIEGIICQSGGLTDYNRGSEQTW